MDDVIADENYERTVERGGVMDRSAASVSVSFDLDSAADVCPCRNESSKCRPQPINCYANDAGNLG